MGSGGDLKKSTRPVQLRPIACRSSAHYRPPPSRVGFSEQMPSVFCGFLSLIESCEYSRTSTSASSHNCSEILISFLSCDDLRSPDEGKNHYLSLQNLSERVPPRWARGRGGRG
eukprot:4296107-Prymnesium_polylepis.1